MSVQVVLILAVLWVLLGLIDAWVLRRLGRTGWRLVLFCALAGPFSLSVVYDEARPADTNGTAPESTEPLDAQGPAVGEPVAEDADEIAVEPDEPIEWPHGDPKSPLLLQGYRGMSDH